jgi:hypothetical protein
MELNSGLYRRHDGKRERRKLRRQLLDAEQQSRYQQRRGWQRRTLDRDRRLLELLIRASGSDGTRCLRHNQLQHEPWLVGGHSTGGMHGEL